MEDQQSPAPRNGKQNSTPVANDEPLLDAVRNGDHQAFGKLYERHRGAVLAVARFHTNSHAEAEDITSEAFTRALALLKSGGGPRQFLRAYLVTAVSRLAADRANDLRRTQPQEPQVQGKLDRVQLFDDTLVRQVDAAVVARAFASLPERWQEVLWYLEIEGYRPRQVASVVGIQPNAVSALGKRAREGLRTAYMQQHVSAQALEECGEYSAQLGAFVRGTLTPSKMKLMQDHLDSCERCTAEYLQLQDLGVGLRGWILPILAGVPLWGDASDRLVAALGTAGAGGAVGVSGVMSATTTPLGACAQGASVPAAVTATATSTASVSAVTASAGGVMAGSATKVILAATGVAVAGTGTAGIVAAVQQDSSEVEIAQQAQPVTQGPAGGSAGSPGGLPSAGGSDSGTKSTGASPPSVPHPTPARDDPAGTRDDPAGIRLPIAPGESVTPQLEVPLIPVLPGPVPPIDPPVSEVAGPDDGPVEDSSEGGGNNETPEVSGPVVIPDLSVIPVPGVPGPVVIPDPSVTPVPEVSGPVETADPSVTPVPEVSGPVEIADPSVTPAPEVPGPDDADTADPGSADPNGPGGNDNGIDTPTAPSNPEAQPGAPEGEASLTPEAPSSPENPPLAGPDTQPTAPTIDPAVPLPTVAVTEPAQPAPEPTDAVDESDATRPENPSDVTGRWGTVPSDWTLSGWIVYLLTGARP